MSDDIEFSEELMELVNKALGHGLSSVSEGGPLVPFVMHELAGKVSIQRHLVQGETEDELDLTESVESARRFAASLSGKAQRVALVLEGRLSEPGGTKMDAIIVQAFEAGEPASYHFGHGFRDADSPGGFSQLGEGLFLGEAPPLW
jgi:hypothetical protein